MSYAEVAVGVVRLRIARRSQSKAAYSTLALDQTREIIVYR